ncbi:hypothetical protein [Stenotrophomonas sp. SY1]|jgi:hypothetical protein|uniref:hypothetical protein n=1 Tax=Stenotrophomonas sp. SY1 TaxID=477235 RepID=UPI001E3B7FB5|nr:hypothetical protein [Stenotrophomonas sp. SY1]MCD9086371.1 hypothetical protein [Stenotrophomonas sp. SY1]
MYTIVILWDSNNAEVVQWDDVPMVTTLKDREISLRAGPRERVDDHGVASQVAVYLPDELTEEEFQELFDVHRKHVPELNLHS